MFRLIFSAVFIFFALLAALLGMLKGKKRDWICSVSRIVIVVLSAVLAMFASEWISWLIAGFAYGALEKALSSYEQLNTILTTLASAPGVLRAVLAMFIAPAIFVTLFLIIKAILNRFSTLLDKLLIKLFRRNKGKEEEAVNEAETCENAQEAQTADDKAKGKKEFHVCGAICGAVCGFLVFVVLLIPFVGTLSLADGVVSVVDTYADKDTSGNNSTMKLAAEISDAACNNACTFTVKALGGNLIYSGLTTYLVNGQLASLGKESRFLSAAGNAVAAVADSDVSKADAAKAIRKAGTEFSKSTVFPMLISDFLNASHDSWSAGKAYCGINRPATEGTLSDVVSPALDILGTSDYDSVRADVKTLLNICAVIVEKNTLSEIKTSDGLISILSDEELTSSIIEELLDNSRLSPLVVSISDTGISLICYKLNIPQKSSDLYGSFMNEILLAVESGNGTAAEERVVTLANDLDRIYNKFGIEIPDGTSEFIAASLICEFSGSNELTQEKLETFLSGNKSGNSEVPSYTEALETVVSGFDSSLSVEELANKIYPVMNSFGIFSDSEALEALSADMAKSMYSRLSENSFDYSNSIIGSSEKFEKISVVVTRDELRLKASSFTNSEDEAKKLAHVFSTSANIIKSVGSESSNISATVVAFGPVLDSFAVTETIGMSRTENILTSILQSEKIRSDIGISMLDATEMAATINASAEKDSYTLLMLSLGNTIDLISKASSNEHSSEEIISLMKDLTPASAEMLQKLSSSDMVMTYGVSEQSSKPVADMLSNMFGNMSDAKQNGMSDEEYEKEAAAVSDMLSIAMSANNSGNSQTFGEGSTTNITATEYVDRATESTIISQTLVSSVYEDGESDTPKVDPLASGRQLSESEKTELVEALDTKWKNQLATSSDEAANKEYQKVLTSIAATVNLGISFSGSDVVAAS